MARFTSIHVLGTVLLSGLVTLIGAQGARPPISVDSGRGPPQSPNSDYFWRRYGCSGHVREVVAGNPDDKVIVNKTLYISLTDKWSGGNVSTTILENYDLEASDDVTLWPSNRNGDKKLYRWGGTVFNENWKQSKPAVAVFSGPGPRPNSQIDSSGSWSNNTAIASAVSPELLRTTGGSWTSCNGQGFVLGGTTPYFVDTASNRAPAVPGLIVFDMEKEEITNVSAAGFGPPQGVARGTHRHGSAVCLSSFGSDKKGLVLFMGGEQANLSSSQWSPMNFSTVYLYDMATKTFHNQTTTGSIPSPREYSCAVATQKRSGSSYEVFLWGGRATSTQASIVYNEVYVLSVPGFTWFKAQDIEPPRYQHACAVIGPGQRQMVSVGGLQSVSRREDSYGQDDWRNGIKIFDMSGWYWRDIFEPAAEPYEPHTEVQKWYSSQDNLKNVKWTNENTKALFPLTSQNNPTNNPDPSQTATPSNDTGSRPATIAGIVGGVVGGVVLLAAAVLLFILGRRRRLRQQWALKQKQQQQTLEDELNSTDTGNGGSRNQPSPVKSEDLYDKQMLDSNQVHELPPQGKMYEMGNDGAITEMPSASTAHYYQLDDGTIIVEMAHNKDVPLEMAHNKDVPLEMAHDQVMQPQELSAESTQRQQTEAQGSHDSHGRVDAGDGTRGQG